jgi:hypothetical protein
MIDIESILESLERLQRPEFVIYTEKDGKHRVSRVSNVKSIDVDSNGVTNINFEGGGFREIQEAPTTMFERLTKR